MSVSFGSTKKYVITIDCLILRATQPVTILILTKAKFKSQPIEANLLAFGSKFSDAICYAVSRNSELVA